MIDVRLKDIDTLLLKVYVYLFDTSLHIRKNCTCRIADLTYFSFNSRSDSNQKTDTTCSNSKNYSVRVISYNLWLVGPYDITAGHLVASSASGDASYLLLDELGCPTDPTTFPALSKDPVDGRSLIATFTAFKFPNSQRVRFNVLVRFCLDKCIPVSQTHSRIHRYDPFPSTIGIWRRCK